MDLPCFTGAESQLAGHRSPQCEPRCPCSEADQELQQLVLSGLPERRPVLGSGFLQAAWRDLEELAEWNSLSCQYCSSPEVQSCPGKGKVESLNVPSTVCSPGAAWSAETHADLKMHVARKSLEVQLGSLPQKLLLSQQQAWGKQCRRILPKLIKPGQTQPLLRRSLCPSLQAKADCITDNILKKQEIRKWGEPNPAEFSMNRLVPCPPGLLLPRNVGLTGKVIRRKAHFQGQAEQQGHPRKEQQCRPKESAKIPLPPSHKQERPTATAALPSPASTSLRKDVSCQTDSTGLRVTDIKASSQRRRAALATISKLQLSQATFGELSMHTARKCLEVKLKCFPVAVRKSMQQQREALLTHPAGKRAVRSQLARRYFHSPPALFLNEEKREGLELHIRSMKLERLGNRLISGSPAVSQEEESASTYVTAPSEAPWAEAGPKRDEKCPSRGESTWSARAECNGFQPVRRTFRGVQQTTTTYRSSLLNACGDPDCDPVAAPTSKTVWGKIFPIPATLRISVSKHVHLACKGRIRE